MGFVINRVYTRSGDKGETGLVGGQRVKKTDLRIAVCGDVDELNASLGVLKESLSPRIVSLAALIEFLQQELFDLGSELATPEGQEYPGMWKTAALNVERLEQLCDRYGEKLPPLTSFILPGGSVAAAHAHHARTIARRAERSLLQFVESLDKTQINPEIQKYLNRLSDLLFVLARWMLAEEGKSAPLWVQDKDRKCP